MVIEFGLGFFLYSFGHLEESRLRQRQDEVVHIRRGKVRHVFTEKFHSLHSWCYNFSLDKSQKQEDIRWYFLVSQRKIYSLTYCSPLPIWVSFPLKFRSWFVTLSVTNWLTHFKKSQSFDYLSYLLQEFSWLKFCRQSLSQVVLHSLICLI